MRALGGRDVEPAFRGDLLAPFGDERDLMRAKPLGDGEHLRGARHLEVEDRRDRCGDRVDVGVLDVAAILAQMRRDAVGAGALAERHGASGTGSSPRRAWRTVAMWSMLM